MGFNQVFSNKNENGPKIAYTEYLLLKKKNCAGITTATVAWTPTVTKPQSFFGK